MKDMLDKYLEYGISLRREFHEHPESSLHESWTSERIEQELTALGIEHQRITETGVIGTIKGNGEGKRIALRADIDALALQTELTTDYASKRDGFMHACGHDAHVAGLLYAAKILTELKDQFPGEIRLIFQPAEENGQGAKLMMKAGVMEGVDSIFGIHVWNDLEVGKINIEAGPRMASAGLFDLTITGKGGHGALPHQTNDAVVIASSIVQELQTVVSREIDPLQPAVVTVGSFHSGTTHNVISGQATLQGTTRAFDMNVMEQIHQAILRISKKTAEAHQGTAELKYHVSVIPNVNEEGFTKLAQDSAKKLFGDVLVPMEKVMGGEDFAYYGEFAPAVFAFVGTKNLAKLENFPHHHPKFDIDDDALKYSAGLFVQVALDYLSL